MKCGGQLNRIKRGLEMSTRKEAQRRLRETATARKRGEGAEDENDLSPQAEFDDVMIEAIGRARSLLLLVNQNVAKRLIDTLS